MERSRDRDRLCSPVSMWLHRIVFCTAGQNQDQDCRLSKQPATNAVKIARYGKLDVKYYPLLDELPKEALPDSPPVGAHQYTLRLSSTVTMAVILKGAMRVQHTPTNRTRQFTFHGVEQVARVWHTAHAQATEWTKSPPEYHPERVAPKPGADQSVAPGVSRGDSDDSGPAPDAMDDSSLNTTDSGSENSSPSWVPRVA